MTEHKNKFTPTFTPCQQKAMTILSGKDNVFVTGVAGSGKSFVIREFVKTLDRKEFPVLASSGAAAVLIGGRTFHSFFGLGIMDGGLDETIKRALENKRVKSRLKKIHGFVLDEVSMIPASALVAAEEILRRVRGIKAPWGGARVICVGDFAQLPPISRGSTVKEWAFQSPIWARSELVPVCLKTVVRQRNEAHQHILNDVRNGNVTERVAEFLNSRVEEVDETYDGTCLFPRRNTTDAYNKRRLDQIDSRPITYQTVYTGREPHITQLKKSAPVPETLTLKPGALVMTRTNDPQYRFVNGSTGWVVRCGADSVVVNLKNGREVELEKSEFSYLDADGRVAATAVNFPLSLAYAVTIHKSQGATLSDALIDLRQLWEPGQAYVALSRVDNPEGLKLMGWNPESIKADEDVKRFYEDL